MTTHCPKCNAPHELSGRAPGERITCACGNVLAVPVRAQGPAPAAGSSGVPIVVIVVLAVLGVPCIIGILAAIAIPNFIKFQKRAKASEARVQVRTLCTGELAYYESHGEWLAAGPLPREIPARTQVAFPKDESFAALGFAPGKVRYQYEVVVDGDPKGANTAVRCVARGDLDGDGKPSLFEVRIGEDHRLGPVRAEHETE